MLLNNYNKLVFDWDNTLVDSLGIIEESYKNVLLHFKRHDLLSNIESLQIGKAKSAKQEFISLFGDDNLEKCLEIFYKTFEKKHLDFIKKMDGCDEILDLIKSLNFDVFVNSNKRHDLLLKEVKYLNLFDYFNNICGAGHCEFDKPSPLGVEYLVGDCAKKNKVLYIGDSKTDYETALNYGCDICIVGDEKIDGVPTFCINSLKDLLNV